MTLLHPLILLTLTGPDRPGITAAVAAAIATGGARIRDIEQTVTGGRLGLSILIDFPDDRSAGKPLVKELLFLARELGVELDFTVMEEEQYRRRNLRQGYVVTLLADQVNPAALARVAGLLAGHGINIERIAKLNQEELRAVELAVAVPPELDVRPVSRQLLQAGSELGVDVAVQRESLYRRVKRLVVMDMDSTLIQGEVIDELARVAGVGEAVAAITARAMNGELDFATSLRERVALLAGLPEAALGQVHAGIPLTPGARNLVRVLQRLGYRTAVISGGFRFFTDRLRAELGLDYAHANKLEIVDGVLTGRVVGPIVDGARKAELLEEIARREGIDLDQTVAIGDGANDLPMLGRAGLGIAFNAKARVREQADTAISRRELDSILYLLGLTEQEQAEVSG